MLSNNSWGCQDKQVYTQHRRRGPCSIKDGEYFGEMALIDNFPRSAHAIAEEETRLLTISKRRLEDFLYNHKDTAYKLLWTFCRTLSTRLRETNEKMSAFLAMTGKF